MFYGGGPHAGEPLPVEVDQDRCEGGVVILTPDSIVLGPDDFLALREFGDKRRPEPYCLP